MTVRPRQSDGWGANAAVSLVEVVISIAILALVMAGMIYGYIQTNRRAEWSSLSLAAQSFAVEQVEQLRAAKWDIHSGDPEGCQFPSPTNYMQTSLMIIPGIGQAVVVTNYVSIDNVCDNPQVRQIRVDCVWRLPSTVFAASNSVAFSNTVITWRGAR